MYRAIIVDDEYYIRRSLINRIDWAKYRIEIVGEAENGQQAYDIIPDLRPDVIFVDIRMPVLDGFDLMELLKEEYPQIIVVIISAYNDFEYAKKAIENRVFDYLLKPLEEAQLDRTMKRLLERLGSERKGRSLRLSELLHVCREDPCVILCVSEQEEEERYRFFAKLEELVSGRGTVYRIAGLKRPMFDAYALCGLTMDADRLAGVLLGMLRSDPDTVSRIGISELQSGVKSEEEALLMLSEAVTALKKKMITSRRILFYDGKDSECDTAMIYDRSELLIAKKAFSGGDYRAAGKALLDYIEAYDWERTGSVIEPELICSTVTQLLIRECYETGLVDEVHVQTNELVGVDYVLRFSNAQELKERLISAVRVLTEEMYLKGEKDPADRITDYIRANYASDLSMETLEQQFFMSPSTMMLTFKKRKGVTIAAYIEAVRMEKAKEMLDSGMISVQETAAMVGYPDANYFCRVFKKYTGITPSKYKMNSRRA